MDATTWLDGFWDEAAGMVTYPSTRGSADNPHQQPGVHLVRESATHAVALLERDGPGDRERAARAIDAVVAHQIDAPGTVVHGTWRRAPAEPIPGPAAREWIDYDPNWREFVGSALLLALHHASRLPPATVAGMESALRRAAEGALARAVPPEYTNIALMSAFLLDAVGERQGEPSWRAAGEQLSEGVARAYLEGGAFPEHNSPTYYGIDLYGLALWRERAVSPALRTRGADLTHLFWNDLARFYHAGLRNLCGPYSRAYGMDMTRYVAGLGCWMSACLPEASLPLPAFGPAVAHAHDFFELPLVAILSADPPEEAWAHLRAFQGDRDVTQVITPSPLRRATASLRAGAMWGGERTSGHIVHWQHHPATIHWRRPDGAVGWMRLATTAPVDAEATERGLTIAVRTGLDWLREATIPIALEFDPASGREIEAARADGTEPVAPAGLALGVSSEPRLAWQRSGDAGAPLRLTGQIAPGAAPDDVHLKLELLSLPN